MPPTLYLIDGHALAYRMYFALTAVGGSQRWQTSKGEPTAGIYGFARELLRIIEQEQPEYLAVAFDVGKTFRDEIFPEYKGTRDKMPDDLRPQIKRIREMVDAFNIPRLELEGYEADDVLGSVARIAAEQGLGVKIVTGDRDLLQLVNKRTAVYLAGDDKTFIKDEDVAQKLGVPPNQVVDYKALVGDKSDNIPGVAGVGEKTAIALLEKYKTLDGIYKNIDKVEPRWKTKLEANKENAYLSYTLAQIKTDLDIKLDLEHAKARDLNVPAIQAFFTELEFRTLLKTLEKVTGQSTSSASSASGTNTHSPLSANASGQMSMFANEPQVVVSPKVESNVTVLIVDTEKKLDDLVKALNKAKVISFDTETTSTEEMRADIVGISLAIQAGEGYYIPIGHNAGTNLPLKKVVAALKAPMTNPKIGKVAHNAKYDYIVLAQHGLTVSPLTFDTMLAEFIVDPSSRSLGLKNLAFVKLGEEMTHIEALIGKGKKQISMADVAIESVAPYAVADAETTLRLMPLEENELKRVDGEKLLAEIDMPLTPVLADMEMTGISLDLPFFAEMDKELTKRLSQIEKKVFDSVGKPFNINSTQQLSDVLFKTLRLEPPDKNNKTASGHYSTAAGVLEELSGKHPVVDWVLEQRELSKIKSTYVDALPVAINPKTNRVHTSYSQIGAVTGRLSSNNPNLQNIPIRTETGRRVRNGFIADKGNWLISVDYSQIELRIVAHMAQDEGMLAAFRADEDIHATTAAAIYNVALDAVTKDMRRHAKAINFGLIYGMSAFGLMRGTDLTLAEAENFVKAYFTKFPGVKKYLDGIRKQAAQQGYVETLLGRRRYFPALQGRTNPQLKAREEREAINAPIQGTAADIMKIAMLKIPPALKKAKLSGKMLLQVHDELVLECPKDELEKTAKVVKETMADAYPLDIPLSTEARYGANWGEMKTI
ncbi:MAG: DNA polymerase I [Anaerolineae bacterium]|nr:DNA polymerase I [Anaerolineae bacterium]MBL8105756.1 DNA polymerase I [Anaerolineales bacterium]MCC7189650.1 DNA polymerase I [Anaerolineales bacterium]